MVDRAFFKFMEEIFGKNVWEKFTKNCISGVHDLRRSFEAKKRTIGYNNGRKYEFFTTPGKLYDIFEELNNKKFDPDRDIKHINDKLKVPKKLMVMLFDETTTAIVDHLCELLKSPALSNVKTVLMVGGFSDCTLLRQKVKSYLADMPISVICPDDAVLSVVKGGVIFGNSRESIHERVCPRTYGIACNKPHKKGQRYVHLEYYDGQTVSTDVFQTLVRKGDPIVIGESEFHSTFSPTTASHTVATIGVYCSSEIDPLFTIGQNVKELGILYLDIPDTMKGKNRKIVITLKFCKSTEIEVVAHEKETNNEVSSKFSCLE